MNRHFGLVLGAILSLGYLCDVLVQAWLRRCERDQRVLDNITTVQSGFLALGWLAVLGVVFYQGVGPASFSERLYENTGLAVFVLFFATYAFGYQLRTPDFRQWCSSLSRTQVVTVGGVAFFCLIKGTLIPFFVFYGLIAVAVLWMCLYEICILPFKNHGLTLMHEI